jgi:hypothetical protein
MESPKVFVFDLPLFQMTGRYNNWWRNLTDHNIFSGMFWLAAILNSGAICLAALIFIHYYRRHLTSCYIFSSEYWLTAMLNSGISWLTATCGGRLWLASLIYSRQWQLAAILTAAVKLQIWIYQQIQNRIFTFFRIWIRGPGGFDWWKKAEGKNLMLLSH